jgi:hypothetical protein
MVDPTGARLVSIWMSCGTRRMDVDGRSYQRMACLNQDVVRNKTDCLIYTTHLYDLNSRTTELSKSLTCRNLFSSVGSDIK